MKIVVDNLLINYEIIGSNKKTILFIHGWGDDHNNLKQAFLNLKKNYRLIFIDLPGFGQSQVPGMDFDIDKYAKLISDFILKLNISIEVIIAHSFGGSVAIKALSRNYLDVKKLILISSSGIRFNTTKKNKLKKIYLLPAKILLSPLPKNLQNDLIKRYYGIIKSDLYLRKDMMPIFRRIVSEDVRKDAALLKMPVLLIYGELDKDTPVEFGLLFHQAIDNSTLEIVTNSGHFVFQERKDKVLKLIQEFL